MNKWHVLHAIAIGFLIGITLGALINGWGNPLLIALWGAFGTAINMLFISRAFNVN